MCEKTEAVVCVVMSIRFCVSLRKEMSQEVVPTVATSATLVKDNNRLALPGWDTECWKIGVPSQPQAMLSDFRV